MQYEKVSRACIPALVLRTAEHVETGVLLLYVPDQLLDYSSDSYKTVEITIIAN